MTEACSTTGKKGEGKKIINFYWLSDHAKELQLFWYYFGRHLKQKKKRALWLESERQFLYSWQRYSTCLVSWKFCPYSQPTLLLNYWGCVCLFTCAQLYTSKLALKIHEAEPQDWPEFVRPLSSALAPKDFAPPPKKLPTKSIYSGHTMANLHLNSEFHSHFDRADAGDYPPLQATASEPTTAQCHQYKGLCRSTSGILGLWVQLFIYQTAP